MSRYYEGMFLLDNAVVREDWKSAKSIVTNVLEKHGAEIASARRWDERRLAYPIKGRKRATYLLAYYKVDGQSIQHLRRDLELDERVLRHLLLAVDSVPEGEAELAALENSADFQVPAPPDDDTPAVVEADEDSDEDPRRRDRGDRERASESKASAKADDDSEDDDSKDDSGDDETDETSDDDGEA